VSIRTGRHASTSTPGHRGDRAKRSQRPCGDQQPTAKDLSNIRRQGWENQQKSEDHVFGQYSDATRGVGELPESTTGETFQLSNQYGHAWVNEHNEYILSDQQGWDPNTVLKAGNWTALGTSSADEETGRVSGCSRDVGNLRRLWRATGASRPSSWRHLTMA